MASLYEAGLDKILAKIDEETGEVIDAARDEDDATFNSHEVADLWFHCMVMLVQKKIFSYQDVLIELEKRFGISGLEEKAQRK